MNQEVADLDSAVDSIVSMLRKDFAFTRQEEAKIASLMGTMRDAFGRWRSRRKKEINSD